MSSEPRISHLKLSIFLNANVEKNVTEKLKEKVVKKINNFYVLHDTYTFIIFPNCRKISVAKVKCFNDAENVIPSFCKLFDLEKNMVESNFKVDNISAYGDFHCMLDLRLLKEQANILYNTSVGDFKVQYDRDIRGGAVCRTLNLGTIIVFTKGKYFIVGSKCQEQVTNIYQKMLTLITDLKKPTTASM